MIMAESVEAEGSGDLWDPAKGLDPLGSLEATLARWSESRDAGTLEVAAEGMQHILRLERQRGKTGLPAWAAFELGLVRAKQNEMEQAATAWGHAMATGDREFGPRAACFLAILRLQQGDLTGAKEAWRFALSAGNERYRPAALLGLGSVAEQQSEVAEALDLWQRAIDTGDPEFGARAGILLACRRLERGEHREAESTFRRVLEVRNEEFRALALLGIGVVGYEQGDYELAVEHLQLAAECADARLLPMIEEYLAEAERRVFEEPEEP